MIEMFWQKWPRYKIPFEKLKNGSEEVTDIELKKKCTEWYRLETKVRNRLTIFFIFLNIVILWYSISQAISNGMWIFFILLLFVLGILDFFIFGENIKITNEINKLLNSKVLLMCYNSNNFKLSKEVFDAYLKDEPHTWDGTEFYYLKVDDINLQISEEQYNALKSDKFDGVNILFTEKLLKLGVFYVEGEKNSL